MMGADGTEEVVVEEDCGTNRDEKIADKLKISAWTKFEFAGRQGKYSDFKWNASNFSGTDWESAMESFVSKAKAGIEKQIRKMETMII